MGRQAYSYIDRGKQRRWCLLSAQFETCLKTVNIMLLEGGGQGDTVATRL